MFKSFGKFLMILLLAIFIIPIVNVEAKDDTITVNNQQELKNALANDEISTIILGQDIETTEKINIMRPVTIDGNHKTIRYTGTFGSSQSSDNTVWGGIYVLQVYRTSATIRNIKLTGGNAALLINGSTVKLEGTIDVSGNGFGGIELGKGSDVTEQSRLVLDDNTNIINTTESSDKPSIWVPDDTNDAVIEKDGVEQKLPAGEELSIDEVQDLFQTQDNPSTNDPIITYAILGILGFTGVLYTYKKLLHA